MATKLMTHWQLIDHLIKWYVSRCKFDEFSFDDFTRTLTQQNGIGGGGGEGQ